MNKLVILLSMVTMLIAPSCILATSSFAQQPNSSSSTNNYSFVTKWGRSGTGEGQFKQPLAVAIDSNGSVYVTDFTAIANQVQKFNANGTFITSWGYLGTGGGGFTN